MTTQNTVNEMNLLALLIRNTLERRAKTNHIGPPKAGVLIGGTLMPYECHVIRIQHNDLTLYRIREAIESTITACSVRTNDLDIIWRQYPEVVQDDDGILLTWRLLVVPSGVKFDVVTQ